MSPAVRPEIAPTPAAEARPSGQRTALITGSNSGIGLGLARKLAADGWRVLLHGRDPEKLGQARLELGHGGPHEAFRADLADLDAVRQLADGVREVTSRLDALIHNAGGLWPSFSRTSEGVETTMAVNALAPFALTEAVRSLLVETAEGHRSARVVTVASEAHRAGRFASVTPEALREPVRPDRYVSIQAYAQSKFAVTAWTLELARRLGGTGVTANACHPGLVRTGVFDGFGWPLSLLTKAFSLLYLPPSVGAESPYLLATDDRYRTQTGRYLRRSHLRGPHEVKPSSNARSPETGKAVWEALSDLAGTGDA